MLLLNMSGGSTRGAGIFGAAERLYELGHKPDVISGVSVGSLLALPIAMDKCSIIKPLILNMSLDTIFDIAPVNNNGRLTLAAYIRALTGKPSLGVQNVTKLIKEIISEREFNNFKSKKEVEIFFGLVNLNSGKKEYIKLSDLSYENYLLTIEASSSVPVYSSPIKIGNNYYTDGCIRDHIADTSNLKLNNIKHCISIYSRPKEEVIKTIDDFKPSNVLKMLERTIEIFNGETSLNDQLLEESYCKDNNIKLDQIFLPRILTSLYDVDKTRIKLLYESGRSLASNLVF